MAATFTPDYEVVEIEPSGRRRKITKFALAGVAVLGVGAALTSAAWSDDVWFGGSASSGTIELSGSTTGAEDSYVPADDQGSLVMIVDDFVLGPDATVTQRVWIMNEGSLPLSFEIGTPVRTGTLLNLPDVQINVTTPDADHELAAGETAAIDIAITTPDWAEGTGQGGLAADNSFVLEIEGSTAVD